MTRTDVIKVDHDLSLDDAVKGLIYHQQGEKWIKGLEHDNLQDSMDEFTELLLKTPRDKVQPSPHMSKRSFGLRLMRTSTRMNLKDDGLEDKQF